ncbi:hypothetical protein VHEMI03575 [[Torrubiella] hemipterigena]|uniref:Biotrophy-associated secreted protein 2 n=1 Tax=[Torrubiella] hemipterigena TaxID=1531966 RepID=A0A0A1TBL0_9HYPO|nr:hypothetical protein VHEMI03575 [[Torrubiella] hemipterigena]
MVRTTIAAVLAFAAITMATGVDPAGEKNFANGKGLQFIFGRCKDNSDCASGCCAGLGDTAVCSGPAVGNAAGKRGCGFPYGGAGAATPPPANAPATPPADAPPAPPADAPATDAPPADAPPADAPPADSPPADAPPADVPPANAAPPPPAAPRPEGCAPCPAGFQ